jgi:hypothetical protein
MSEYHKWKPKELSHDPRPRRELDNPDVFFTLKVYSQMTGRDHRSLKFTVDFNAPFEATVDNLEPYYISTHDKRNVDLFKDILEHVSEVYRYISDPLHFQPKDGKFPITEKRSADVEKDRGAQQEALAEILRLTKGRINHFFYEQGSNNRVGVSAVLLSDGDGDPRPPKNG